MPDNRIMVKAFTEDGKVYETKFVEFNQLAMIDEALNSLGEYGEVRLVVEKSKLRFLVTQQSYDALKWQSGKLSR